MCAVFCHLILYDHDIFHVPLDVQSLEKLGDLPIFVPSFVVDFNRLSSFLQSSWLRCKILSIFL